MAMTVEDVKETINKSVDASVAEKVKGLEAGIEAKVDEKFKTIDISKYINLGEFSQEKELKVFNRFTGKIEAVRKVEEVEDGFNKMLHCLGVHDLVNAQAISKEIDQENNKMAARLSYKTPTPARSDSDAVGGYAVPTEVDSQISQMIYLNSVMYANANKNAVIFNSKVMPVMYGITISDIANQGTAVTESYPTFTNPSVDAARCGAFTAVSNEFISQKGTDLVSAFIAAYSSAMAEFLDLRLAVGCVTGSSDLVDGCVFDANAVLASEVAAASFAFSDLETNYNAINYKATNLKWVGNRKMKSLIGGLKDDAGSPLFPNYYQGGEFSPLGVPFVLNPIIPSTLDVGSDARATGTDDVLILIDFSKFVAVMDETTRIDLSKDYYFTTDLTTIRGIRRYGCKVLFSNTSASGGVCRAIGITN